MAKKDTKYIKSLRRERAMWELDIRIRQLLADYKSKEEPTVRLTTNEVLSVLSAIITKQLSK